MIPGPAIFEVQPFLMFRSARAPLPFGGLGLEMFKTIAGNLLWFNTRPVDPS